MLSPVIVTNATSLCLASLAVYYLTASVFLARSSIPELALMPLNVSTAISAVPAGLVRKRGMLFFAEACMVLLVPTVKPGYMRSLLLGWGVRLITGACRALMGSGNFASAEKVPATHWRPEALVSMALGLCCIAASFHSSARTVRQQESNSTADNILERKASVTEEQKKTPGAMHIVLMVSAGLSMLGVGMLLSPELFIDSLVCTECIRQRAYQATVASNISPIPPPAMDHFLTSQLQVSRRLTSSLGIQLVCEAANLLLLPLALEDPVLQWVLCVICALRAVLATMVAALNFGLGGLLPVAHADTGLCALFGLLYTAQAYLYYPTKELSNKSD